MGSPDLGADGVVPYTVLILAPTGHDAAILHDSLSKDGMQPRVCEDLKGLCDGIDTGAGAAILAEEAFTPSGIEILVQTIHRQPEWSDFPIIVMAGAGAQPDRTWAILGDVVHYLNINVLERPVLMRTLLAAVRSSLRSREAQYRIAEELRLRMEAEASLARANKEMQSFSYSVSHDLQAPLRTVESFSGILLEDYTDKLDDMGRDYLNRIANGAGKMRVLIEDMLNLSRISQQEMTVREIDLSALARSIIEELRETEPDRPVTFVEADNLRALGDERLIRIALTNLLGNAWKYTGKTAQPRIEFGSVRRDEGEVFFVRDNGAGFSMDYAEKLFVPFQRLHTEKEFHGSGIGLPIVQRVIERHGGQIWGESERDKGTTFYFTLSRK